MRSDRSSRRGFLKRLARAGMIAGVPYWIPRGVLASPVGPGANEVVNLAIIGVGYRANHFLDNMPRGGRVVAICDVAISRAEAATAKRNAAWKTYQDYRALLDKERVDGVIHCTCDHNRVLPAIHACQASRDVYVEKPFSLYVFEGRALVNAVRRYGRICQTGTQARTIGTTRTLLEMIRGGRIGKLRSITCRNYSGPVPYPGGPAQSVPPPLDWEKWCGQTELIPYNKTAFSQWTSFSNYCSGQVGFLGAHAYDMIQSALGMDETGPVELWTTSEPGQLAKVRMRYANGFEVSLEGEEKSTPFVGAIFAGESGKIEINEHIFRTNPPELAEGVPPPEVDEIGRRPGWMGKSHLANWIECIKTRKRPNAYEEIGHRSATICHLVNITKQLGRRLRWDPAAERFIGDEQANTLLSRPRRKGHDLPS